MIDGVFKQCFKVVTREEVEKARPRHNSRDNVDDDVTVIGQKSGAIVNGQPRPPSNSPTNTAGAHSNMRPAMSAQPNIVANMNRSLQQVYIGNQNRAMSNQAALPNTRRASHELHYASNASPIQPSNLTSSVPIVSSNQLYNSYSTPLQSLSNCANSISPRVQSNFMTHTGIATNNQLMYGNNQQQAYVGATAQPNMQRQNLQNSSSSVPYSTYMTVVPVQTTQAYTTNSSVQPNNSYRYASYYIIVAF